MKTGPSICVLLGTSFICQNEYKKVMRFDRLTNDKPCHICGIVRQMFADEKSGRGISILRRRKNDDSYRYAARNLSCVCHLLRLNFSVTSMLSE